MAKELRVGMISWAHVHAEFRAKATTLSHVVLVLLLIAVVLMALGHYV